MELLFKGQLPKDPLLAGDIEDVIVSDPKKGRVAISDGASESFDSKNWARLLADHFVQNSKLNASWLNNAVKTYLDKFDQAQMSWSMQAAFERGSFATLLGIEHFTEDETVEISGIGDSIAVLLDGVNFVDSFPYKSAEQFEQRPELFCTNNKLNSCFYSPDFFSQHCKEWNTKDIKEPVVLCMTDALGEWAFRNVREGQPMWHTLSKINSALDLKELVMGERITKKMCIDDVTLLKLSLQDRKY